MTKRFADILKEVDLLSTDEKSLLAAHLAARPPSQRARSWNEVRGAAAHPLAGEDAQDWVSRSRREDQRKRDSA